MASCFETFGREMSVAEADVGTHGDDDGLVSVRIEVVTFPRTRHNKHKIMHILRPLFPPLPVPLPSASSPPDSSLVQIIPEAGLSSPGGHGKPAQKPRGGRNGDTLRTRQSSVRGKKRVWNICPASAFFVLDHGASLFPFRASLATIIPLVRGRYRCRRDGARRQAFWGLRGIDKGPGAPVPLGRAPMQLCR